MIWYEANDIRLGMAKTVALASPADEWGDLAVAAVMLFCTQEYGFVGKNEAHYLIETVGHDLGHLMSAGLGLRKAIFSKDVRNGRGIDGGSETAIEVVTRRAIQKLPFGLFRDDNECQALAIETIAFTDWMPGFDFKSLIDAAHEAGNVPTYASTSSLEVAVLEQMRNPQIQKHGLRLRSFLDKLKTVATKEKVREKAIHHHA